MIWLRKIRILFSISFLIFDFRRMRNWRAFGKLFRESVNDPIQRLNYHPNPMVTKLFACNTFNLSKSSEWSLWVVLHIKNKKKKNIKLFNENTERWKEDGKINEKCNCLESFQISNRFHVFIFFFLFFEKFKKEKKIPSNEFHVIFLSWS